ncbi:hypothetical protein LAM87_24860, partial [Mycobacterium tuberculosis]|nr:hypothetical protein [Mycobacterium tuberculosis]
SLPDLLVSNPDAEIAVSGSYANPGHGRGSLDLRADFARASVARSKGARLTPMAACSPPPPPPRPYGVAVLTLPPSVPR